jgi:hypothetical protein
MAFVGISKDFMLRVEEKIGKMRQSEVKALGEETPKLHIHNTDPFFMQTYWGDHAPLYKQMPTEWLTPIETAYMKFKIPGADRKREMDNWFSFHAKPTNGTPFFIPPRTSTYEARDCDPTNPLMAEVLDYALKLNEIDVRWETVKSKVVVFLHACKSANEAIKLWPDVKTYFHTDDIARLDIKAVRSGSKDSAAAEALAGIDTNEIMSAAVIARLSGAQV